ncbi:hypothetical protein BBF96_06305 [Anoxybacter fermentans]|uniref:Cell division protein FtsL n=1 Tax=Anoxybacter fermentans TaxID=1323375 RepID=A0A3Q9HPW6_9FIRM|nr:FtsL-like putative cell division protein [Anoxybacter fermentans]AZR73043.1 hypothetical protein BBF96_06305 [Anoxybacter fermentans]
MILAKNKPQYKYDSKGFRSKQENRLKIKKDKKRQIPFVLKAVGIGCIIFLFGLIVILYIHQYVQISRTNYQIETLKRELAQLKAENEKIRLEIAQNKSLKKIEEKARERFGMVDPENVYYITLKSETTGESRSSQLDSKEKDVILFVQGVADWFKNLTSVEAGTLDD